MLVLTMRLPVALMSPLAIRAIGISAEEHLGLFKWSWPIVLRTAPQTFLSSFRRCGELCTQAIKEPQQSFEYWNSKLKERSP